MAANSQNQSGGSPAKGGSNVSKNTFAGSRLPEGIDARLMVVSNFAKAPSPDNDQEDNPSDESDNQSAPQSEPENEPAAAQSAGGAAFNETQRADQLAQQQNQDRNQANKQSMAEMAKMATNPEAALAKQAMKSAKSVESGVTQELSSLLKSSWEFLIESFLLSIVWIDIHVFLNFIGIKQFCKLGYEWVPQEIAQADPDKAKEAGEKLNMVETMGCCCVNGVCGMAIMMIIFQVSLIVAMFQDPWGMLQLFGTTIANMAKALIP